MRPALTAILLLGCGCTPASNQPAPGDPLFIPALNSPLVLEGDPSAVRAADFNHDQRTDLLVILTKPVGLLILLADPAGRFRPTPPQAIGLPFAPGELVLADFNADSHLDLAAATHQSYDVLALLGDGSGRFTPAPGSPFPAKQGTHPHAHGLLGGDLNHDQHLDLLLIHSNPDNDLVVLLNDGTARFTPTPDSPIPLGRAPYPAALADLNADGHLDLATPDTNSTPPTLTLLFGDGRGAFRPAPSPPRLKILRPFFVAAGDLDGDNDPDLIVTHDDAERATILLNNGRGTFTESPASPFPLGGPAWNAVIADLNADGRIDFATAGASHVRVFLKNASGAFEAAPGSPYPAARGSWQLVLADLNSDRKPDLLTCGVETRHITILLHR